MELPPMMKQEPLPAMGKTCQELALGYQALYIRAEGYIIKALGIIEDLFDKIEKRDTKIAELKQKLETSGK